MMAAFSWRQEVSNIERECKVEDGNGNEESTEYPFPRFRDHISSSPRYPNFRSLLRLERVQAPTNRMHPLTARGEVP